MSTEPATPTERIRAYLDAFPNAVNLGPEIAWHIRHDGHPYALDREDIEAILDALARVQAI